MLCQRFDSSMGHTQAHTTDVSRCLPTNTRNSVAEQTHASSCAHYICAHELACVCFVSELRVLVGRHGSTSGGGGGGRERGRERGRGRVALVGLGGSVRAP
jgi:hypothetical protein